jgi:hypothetical protein
MTGKEIEVGEWHQCVKYILFYNSDCKIFNLFHWNGQGFHFLQDENSDSRSKIRLSRPS